MNYSLKIYTYTMLVVLFVLGLSVRPAHAYLDAGTGSMLLQLLLGGLAGLAVLLKLFWHKILGIFGISKGESKDV